MAKYTVYIGNTPMVKNVSHGEAINNRAMFRQAGLPAKIVCTSTGTIQRKTDRLNRKRKRKKL